VPADACATTGLTDKFPMGVIMNKALTLPRQESEPLSRACKSRRIAASQQAEMS
jgi:hypothetical protein